MTKYSRLVHFAIIAGVLHILRDHSLEVFIVMFLMYEVGFEIPVFDDLMRANNRFNHWLHKKLDRKRRKAKNVQPE